MESKKLNEKDKNFHPPFQVHCLDDVSFLQIGERIWRFLLRGNWGCIFFFFWCSGDRHERAKLSVHSLSPLLPSLCLFLSRENVAGIDFCFSASPTLL